ncbi:hypothetical protein PENTCL1PPCAC_24070, partial [Pristionchus entomophagus]
AARMAVLRPTFNTTDVAFAYFHENEDYESINLIGHSEGITSESVSFAFGPKVASNRIEGATIVFYLRALVTVLTLLVSQTLTEELDTILESVDLLDPNAPTKRYRVPLRKDAVERMIVGAEDGVFSLKISVKTTEKDDELLMLPGMRCHQQHMGVVLILQFPSDALISKRR